MFISLAAVCAVVLTLAACGGSSEAATTTDGIDASTSQPPSTAATSEAPGTTAPADATRVKDGDRVKVHYTGSLEDGEVFDSSEGREPLEFVVASGQVIKGFDDAVRGLAVGETRSQRVEPLEGYGESDPNAVMEFELANLPEGVVAGDELTSQTGGEGDRCVRRPSSRHGPHRHQPLPRREGSHLRRGTGRNRSGRIADQPRGRVELAMHPIDLVASVLVKHGPRRLRIFPGGWGDAAAVAELDNMQDLQESPPDIAISWGSPTRLADRTITDGHFAAVTVLPAAARTATVRMIEPGGGSDRLCLLMAAWNDHGYDTRQRLADELVARGIGSLILEIPYYGSRRTVPEGEQPIQTVGDFALMGMGAVVEGRALLNHFRERYRMGVSGYSMGGNIGALVGATAGFPVAMAPLAASHSPGPVFLDGVISNGIQWDALGGRGAAADLREALTAASVLRVPSPAWSGAAVLVAAKSDGFIPASAVEQLHQHWTGSELRRRRGGHATLLWRGRAALAQAIDDSFSRVASL